MTLLSAVTPASVRRAYDRLGYRYFTEPYDLNVFAVRSNLGGATGQSRQTDRMDDVLGVAFTDERGRQQLLKGWGTTDAGLTYLQRKLGSIVYRGRRVARTAIKLPGQYPGMFDYGTARGHKGYPAGRQVGPARFSADIDRDHNLDLNYRSLPGGQIEVIDPDLVFEGVIYANRHRARRSGVTALVGPHSAACEVWADAARQAEEVRLVRQQAAAGHGTRCTSTLFTRLAFS